MLLGGYIMEKQHDFGWIHATKRKNDREARA